MRKIFIALPVAVAALAIPTAAMAAAPDSDPFATKDNAKAKTNLVANNSSLIIQNGQWVGGHNDYAPADWWTDQTSEPGSRSAHVQDLLGHDGTGKPVK